MKIPANLFQTVALLLTIIVVAGCNQYAGAEGGFSLPEGDAEEGQLVFIEMQCIQCHTLAGTDLSADEWRVDDEMRAISVEIGGTSTKLQTYGDLVTSIINPSHRIAKGYNLEQITENGESKMYNYNDVLRVSELIDLVTFLKTKYELRSVPLTIYPYYIYPGGE